MNFIESLQKSNIHQAPKKSVPFWVSTARGFCWQENFRKSNRSLQLEVSAKNGRAKLWSRRLQWWAAICVLRNKFGAGFVSDQVSLAIIQIAVWFEQNSSPTKEVLSAWYHWLGWLGNKWLLSIQPAGQYHFNQYRLQYMSYNYVIKVFPNLYQFDDLSPQKRGWV